MTMPTPNMSGHNPTPAPAQPDCLICRIWEQMPYAKRHTTPISVQEGEGCLIVGFWLRARHPADQAIRYCERHAATMRLMDDRQSAQEKAKADALAQAASPDAQRAAMLRSRANDIAAKTIAPVLAQQPPMLSPPILPVIAPAVVSQQAQQAFANLQPGQVVTTDPTPAPVQATCTCGPPVANVAYCEHCRHQPGCPVHVTGCPRSPSFGSPPVVKNPETGILVPADTLGAGSIAAQMIADRQIPSLLDNSPPAFPPSAQSLAGQAGSILQEGLPEAKEEPKEEPPKFPCPMCNKMTFSGDIHVCS